MTPMMAVYLVFTWLCFFGELDLGCEVYCTPCRAGCHLTVQLECNYVGIAWRHVPRFG